MYELNPGPSSGPAIVVHLSTDLQQICMAGCLVSASGAARVQRVPLARNSSMENIITRIDVEIPDRFSCANNAYPEYLVHLKAVPSYELQ